MASGKGKLMECNRVLVAKATGKRVLGSVDIVMHKEMLYCTERPREESHGERSTWTDNQFMNNI